jgi:hypothetical protein
MIQTALFTQQWSMTPSTHSDISRDPKTDAGLTLLCRHWQSILRLQDWDVAIRFARPWELTGDVNGEVELILAKRRATIRILAREDRERDADDLGLDTIEFTVVHELLHLHFSCLVYDEDTPAHEHLEQVINALASSFTSSAALDF